MRFKINRNVLLEIFKSIYKVVPKESPMKELTCFLFEANEDDGFLYITATNLEVSVQRKVKVPIESGGSMLIDAKYIYEFVQLLGDMEVEFTLVNEGTAEIKAGNCVCVRKVMNPKSYPKTVIPFPDTMATVSNLSSMYTKTRGAVVSSGVPDGMKGIHFDIRSNGFRVISCNLQNISMVSHMMDCENSMEFTLPKLAYMYLAVAAGDEEIKVGTTDTHVVFMRDGLTFSTRKMVHDYVNVDNILNGLKPVYSMKVEYSDFKPQFENTHAVALMGSKTSYIGLEFTDDKIIVTTQNDIGKCINEVDAVKISGEENMKFFYQATHLKNVFDTVEGTLIIQVDKRGYILIRDRYNRFMMTRVSEESVKKQLEEYKKPKKPKSKTNSKKKSESEEKVA